MMLFYGEKQISKILRVSQSTAFQIIVKLRKELEEKGYLSNIKGGIQAEYFCERFDLVEILCEKALKDEYLAIYSEKEVCAILDISTKTAYEFIRILREDFHKKGFLTPKRGYIQGHYFRERYMLKQRPCEKILKEAEIQEKQEAS